MHTMDRQQDTPAYEKAGSGGEVVFRCAFDPDVEAKVILLDHETGKILREEPFTRLPWHGNVRQAVIRGVDPRKTDYVYAVGNEIMIDPRARIIRGREHFGSMEKRRKYQIRCSFPSEGFEWGSGEAPPQIPGHALVAYGLHVRGFTRHSSLKGAEKGTFAGLARKVDYLKKLGVNQVILMPCYEFEEIEEKRAFVPVPAYVQESEQPAADRKLNCWGFAKSWYFAPKTGYCATDTPDIEFKSMVRSLHAAGIEVIMEIAFPDEVAEDLALEVLRFWTTEYHVDGFFLLCRSSIIYTAAHDALLGQSRLLAGYFDPDCVLSGDSGARDARKGCRHLYNCNDGFKIDVRKLLKGDADMTAPFVERVRQGGGRIGSVNYITSHDGFTMMDLVSYDRKHNEENGENGMDGAGTEYSWNCGVEGPTRKRTIRALRLRQIKNAFAMLILSRGIPLLRAGDELGNTQGGNSNPYCIDSPVTWVDWNNTKMAGEIFSFVQALIRFRAAHPMLAAGAQEGGEILLSNGYPAFSVHSERAWYGSYDGEARHVGLMYGGMEDGQETFIYVACNLYWEPRMFALPHLPEGMEWKVALDTGAAAEGAKGTAGKTSEAGNTAADQLPEAGTEDSREEPSTTEPAPIRKECMVPARTVWVLCSSVREERG